jgi:hypothetical protein
MCSSFGDMLVIWGWFNGSREKVTFSEAFVMLVDKSIGPSAIAGIVLQDPAHFARDTALARLNSGAFLSLDHTRIPVSGGVLC